MLKTLFPWIVLDLSGTLLVAIGLMGLFLDLPQDTLIPFGQRDFALGALVLGSGLTAYSVLAIINIVRQARGSRSNHGRK